MTINVSLTPELEDMVRKRVESGRYTSASEVVREALRLLDTFESNRALQMAKLRAAVDLGLKDLEEGRVSDFVPGETKRRGRQKLAARLAARKR